MRSTNTFTYTATTNEMCIQIRQFGEYYVDNIYLTYPNTTALITQAPTPKNYRYGFNGMERDNEVSGNGNSYTAEFWQYSPRLGRRWNIDPVVKPHESPYATFANNPIWFVDPNGADTSFKDNQARKDFMNAYDKTQKTILELESKMNESIVRLKSFDISTKKGKRKFRTESKKFDKIAKNLSGWRAIKSNFDYIISKNTPMVTYSSDASFLGVNEKGRTTNYYGKLGGLLHSLVIVRPFEIATYIHEDRHVLELKSASTFDKEKRAFKLQQIFDYMSVEKQIEKSFRKNNTLYNKDLPRPSSYGLKEMIKDVYRIKK